jgi:hypothetical protein
MGVIALEDCFKVGSSSIAPEHSILSAVPPYSSQWLRIGPQPRQLLTSLLILAFSCSPPPRNVCPEAQLCDGICCSGTDTCVTDVSSGNSICALNCTSSAQCPDASPCCTPLTGSCQAGGDCPSACVSATVDAGQACRCTVSSECSTGCCAPGVDQYGDLVGFSSCKDDNGLEFSCCNSVACLGSRDCCVTDSQNNNYCSYLCGGDMDCVAGHCDTLSGVPASCGGAGSYFCGN